MKSWIPLLVAWALSVSAVIFVVQRRDHARHETVLATQREAAARDLAALAAELAELRRQPPPAPVAQSPAPIDGPNPDRLLEELLQLRPQNDPQRIPVLRDIVYHLEALARIGEPAVPPIRSFLLRFEDISYTVEREPAGEEVPAAALVEPSSAADSRPEGRPGRAEFARSLAALTRGLRDNGPARRPPRLEFELPPTLRLGLVDVLHQIGGESAEATLGEMLQQTSRALEIAYVAKALQSMSGDRWREACLNTAHELLTHPGEGNPIPRMDRRAQDYLYSVLDLFHDTTFAATAAQLLINGDGRLDRRAFDYLTRTLGNDALPTLQMALNDPRLTNLTDRASLLQRALPRVGQDPAATAMFSSVINDASLPAEVRAIALESLSPRRRETELTPEQLQARYDLLQSLAPTITDATLARSFQRATGRLNEQITGQPGSSEDRPRARRPDRSSGNPGKSTPVP